MAQQARPNCAGQIAERRAHWISFSTVVVISGSSGSSPCSWPCACAFMSLSLDPLGGLARTGRDAPARAPVEDSLAPDVDEPDEQDQEERHDLHEPGPPEVAQRHRPRIEERHLDVEEQEDHRDEVELHRLPLAGVANRGHAAFVRRELFRGGIFRSEEEGKPNHHAGESDAKRDHDYDPEPAVHRVFSRPPSTEARRAKVDPVALVKSFATCSCYRNQRGEVNYRSTPRTSHLKHAHRLVPTRLAR